MLQCRTDSLYTLLTAKLARGDTTMKDAAELVSDMSDKKAREVLCIAIDEICYLSDRDAEQILMDLNLLL